MGTDIHMVAEVRKDGVWHTLSDKNFVRWEGTDYEDWVCCPYSDRNYNLFGILADVRNGRGFGGSRTGEKFNSISKPKGYPVDICENSWEYLSQEHSASYLNLKEIFDFDWTQLHRSYGIISEKVYKDTIMKGEIPDSWCGDIFGPNYVKIPETEMVDLIQGLIPRKKDTYYFTGCYFKPESYADCAEDFLEAMEKLKKYVPEGGTLEDVRIVFDFDS